MREEIETVLAALRPALQRDGGDLQFVEISTDGVVTLRATGFCGCPVSLLTLRAGIENALRERIPSVSRVVTIR